MQASAYRNVRRGLWITAAAFGAGVLSPVAGGTPAWAAPAKGEAKESKATRDPKTIKDPFTRGMEYFKQGNLAEALAAFQLEEKDNPKDPIVHSWIGFVQFKQARYDDAIKSLNRSVQLGPNNADTYNNLGNAYLADGQTDAAIEAYRQAVELIKDRPEKNADPYYNLGNALVKKGDLEGALDAFSQAEKISPDDPLIQNNLGYVYERKFAQDNQAPLLREAVEHYRAAVQKDPNNAVFQRNYGLAARRLDSEREAGIKALRRAVELDSKDYNAHLALAEEYQASNPDQAIAEYRAAAALRPNEFVPRYNLGLLYARLAAELPAGAARNSRYQNAIAQLEAAVKIRPTDHRALSALGWANFKADRLEQAATYYGRAIQAAPDLQSAHANLGLVMDRLRKPDAAMQHWRDALRLDPADASTRALLASAYLSKRQYEEAVNHYQQVVKASNRDARSYNNLGFAYEKLGKMDEAIAAYKQAIEIDPRLAIAHNNLGAAYERRGNPELARQYYQKARAIDPNFEDAKRNLQRLNGGS